MLMCSVHLTDPFEILFIPEWISEEMRMHIAQTETDLKAKKLLQLCCLGRSPNWFHAAKNYSVKVSMISMS